jgi:RluA family pseudouridine synthase
MTAAIEILAEEGPCLVVNKPGGVLTQAPRAIDSLEGRIRRMLEQRQDAARYPPYLGVPHRLDRPVSGAIVFATRRKAAHKLARQFERREVFKCYAAVVQGQVTPEHGTWRDHMRKIPDVAGAETVPPDHPDAREAVLHYRVLWRNERGSLLRIELESGRMHQIRLQAAVRGCPVLGDVQYGATSSFGPQAADPRGRWIALHACQLHFQQPTTKERVAVTAPLPACWRDLELPPSRTVLLLSAR